MSDPDAPPVVAVVGAVPGTIADAAVAAARLGAEVRLVGHATDARQVDDLAAEGIDVSAVSTADHVDADPVRQTLETSLWVTDGTPDGTVQLHTWDLFSGPFQTAAAGSRLFFIAPAPSGGRELWTSDGTPAGTRPLTSFTPLDPFVPRYDDFFRGFVIQAVEGQLCFLANDCCFA